jgi:type IV pilus assembly protein PilB
MNVLQLLIDKNILTSADVAEIEGEVSAGRPLEEVLAKRGISASDVLAAKGEYLKVPTRQLAQGEQVPFEVLQYIPEESATHYNVVPLAVKDGVLEVGIVDSDNIEALDALNFISTKIGIPFKIFLISETDFGKVVEMYKGLSGAVGKALGELETELSPDEKKRTALFSENVESLDDVIVKPGGEVGETNIKENAPVTKMVATMLRYAIEGRASDIHVEPGVDQLRVRFRMDGILHTSLKLPMQVHRAVVARIKILCSMKLDEKRKPQDGRFSANIEGRRVDFRVSTFPSYHGEKVVMRILDRQKNQATVADLGLTERSLNMVRSAVKHPYGLILISGPTGSGKSTTLYSMLLEVDREEQNVISLEDPVEYDIPGMNQSQVRPEIGYTFASGLRSILRQDPDIIMVGEIRDKETAQLAIQAALTGHLVFSTIHTNNAAGVIPRLVDMGVDPYLIAPTLILAVAQRLVRTLCPGSGKKIPVEGSIKMMLEKQFADLPEQFKKEIPKADTIFGIESTADCPNGVRGRTAVFEMFEMNAEMEQVILKNPVEDAIYEVARKGGMLSMKEDAILKMMQGKIPFEEVNTLGGEMVLDEQVETKEQEPTEEEKVVE